MKLLAVDIRDIDFSLYGKVYNMMEGGEGLVLSKGDGYDDCCTIKPLIDTPASLGFTKGTAVPFSAKMMERHGHTQEAQFCESQPIVFLVAPPTEGPNPNAKDVKAVILPKGYIALLERGVWHSSSHGFFSDSYYYWIAHVYEGEPTEWQAIDNGPIEVEVSL